MLSPRSGSAQPDRFASSSSATAAASPSPGRRSEGESSPGAKARKRSPAAPSAAASSRAAWVLPHPAGPDSSSTGLWEAQTSQCTASSRLTARPAAAKVSITRATSVSASADSPSERGAGAGMLSLPSSSAARLSTQNS